ncbi:MAG: M28 family metallopeptidase [Clostridiales bacterium]|nr:M28 family metallopeptidase [Clostridiales bacterium]
MKKIAGSFIVFLVLIEMMPGVRPVLAQEGFSREKALEHLKVLAGTIGPRPLGSPQEKAALAYFAEKLAGFGCQVEWQPVKEGEGMLWLSGLNTESFNVIGRLPGRTPREIIVGAHIDSASPEVPGANDDGSGVATIIELARVLAQEQHEATLVFVAFCGEESGLIGSKSFVKNYPLENVALMLQLDMTSNDSPLMLFIDAKKSQTPAWLVSASIDAYHSLGYRNIVYPTFFQSLNNAIGGATSDHEPFMKKGIPAIGFITNITYPIHTPNDSLEYFEPEGLERSGRLVLELIQKFGHGQPEAKTGHYMLVMLGGRPFFVPLYWLTVLIILSLILGLATFIRLYEARKQHVNWEEDRRIKKSWPKLLVLNLIIIVVMFSSLWFAQLLSGARNPWYAHPGAFVIFAFLFFIFGIWLSLQLTRRWRLRKNAFFYFARASIYLTLLVAAAWLASGPRLALFPAAGLLFISLACLVPWGWLKGLFWIVAPFWMFRLLVLTECANFPFRTAAMGMAGMKTFVLNLLFWSAGVLVFIIWTMPFLVGFAATYRSGRGDLWAMKKFRRQISLIPIGILIIGGAVYLRTIPAYKPPWQQEVNIAQKLDAEGKTSVEFSSFGYLKGMRVMIDGRQEIMDERTSFRKIDLPLEMDWLEESISVETEAGETDIMARLKLGLDFEKPPYSVTLKIKSDCPFTVEKANVKVGHKKKSTTVRWFSHPPQSLRPELDVRLPKGAKLEAEIIATFLETPVAVSCDRKDIHFVQRAEIKRKIKLLQ